MGYLIFCTDSSRCSVPTVNVLYQCTEFSFMPDFYKINPIPVFSTVNIEELASFYPVQMHNIKSLSTKFRQGPGLGGLSSRGAPESGTIGSV